MDESRKAFEQWFPEMVEGMPPGMVEVFDKMLFMAWEASRAAIEIKLDDKVMVEDEFDKGHNCAIDYGAEAIRAAGIKVKE
ncbi:hypothetical protein [Enterobacter roggenkampii]|uniref:hypothetical protein n=1 Tax=Enterobacter roggenkampii TaxID=1812935 RepID=UPI001E429700|nr:hypothetical protein [Enterobacter roggenkampii]MCE1464240.1 hypothetical protein [Enterobacter roggenkampii]